MRLNDAFVEVSHKRGTVIIFTQTKRSKDGR